MLKELPKKEKVEEEIRKVLERKRKLSGNTFLYPPKKKLSKMTKKKVKNQKTLLKKVLLKGIYM